MLIDDIRNYTDVMAKFINLGENSHRNQCGLLLTK
jgi:hypothetical protein